MSIQDDKSRKLALEMFGDYLHSENISEHQWQSLFTDNPFILTESIPIRISSLYPQVELESGRPDFIFIEQPDSTSEFGYYGLIELKRPQDKILQIYSSKHIARSSKLAQAQDQVNHYLDELRQSSYLLANQFTLLLGHTHYAFIIMGSSSEVLRKCKSELHKLQFHNLLPLGIDLLPYDVLFERFRRNVRPVLIMDIMPFGLHDMPIREPNQFPIILDDNWGDEDKYRSHLLTEQGLIPIFDGRYRQVFGIPRKIWPTSDGRWVDNYFYEWEKSLGKEHFVELIKEAKKRNLPYEALEIQGEFDSNETKWLKGAQMKLHVKGEGLATMEMQEWKFDFYEGDKIYLQDGRTYAISSFNR